MMRKNQYNLNIIIKKNKIIDNDLLNDDLDDIDDENEEKEEIVYKSFLDLDSFKDYVNYSKLTMKTMEDLRNSMDNTVKSFRNDPIFNNLESKEDNELKIDLPPSNYDKNVIIEEKEEDYNENIMNEKKLDNNDVINDNIINEMKLDNHIDIANELKKKEDEYNEILSQQENNRLMLVYLS